LLLSAVLIALVTLAAVAVASGWQLMGNTARAIGRLPQLSSLASEIRRGAGVQGSTVRTLISAPQGEASRCLVDSGFSGSPSFVAVVQPTDLWHCHD